MIKPIGSFTAEIHFLSHSSNIEGSYLGFNTISRIINTHSAKVYWEISLTTSGTKARYGIWPRKPPESGNWQK